MTNLARNLGSSIVLLLISVATIIVYYRYNSAWLLFAAGWMLRSAMVWQRAE